MERAKQIGAPDAVIHCAAVLCFGSCEETALADYARVMETNFLGMVRVNQQVLPLMRETSAAEWCVFVHQRPDGAAVPERLHRQQARH